MLHPDDCTEGRDNLDRQINHFRIEVPIIHFYDAAQGPTRSGIQVFRVGNLIQAFIESKLNLKSSSCLLLSPSVIRSLMREGKNDVARTMDSQANGPESRNSGFLTGSRKSTGP